MATANLGGLEVSSMGFGCMGVTAFYGPPMDDDAAFALFKVAHEGGYTHFDTAEIYRSGNPFELTDDTKFNEVQLGKYLQSVPRESFTVASKFFPGMHGGACDLATVQGAVDASLARLGLAHIDLYYCHRMPDSVEKLEEWMASMKAIVESGKVKHVGLSEVGPDWLCKAHAVHPVSAVQQEWSLLTRNLEDSVVPACKKLGVGIVAYSPLARNLLCDPAEAPKDWRQGNPRYSEENFAKNKELVAKIKAMAAKKERTAAQLSLAWLYHKARILGVSMIPIPGTTKAERAAENFAAQATELSDEEIAELEALGSLVAGPRGNEQYLQSGIEAQLGQV